MEKAKKALEDLSTLASNSPDVEVAVAYGPVDEDSSGPPKLQTLNLAQDAEDFFRNVVTKAVVKPSLRWNLRPLDILYKPDEREVEYRELEQLEPVQLAVAPLENLAPLDAFTPANSDVVKGLQYSAITLTNSDGQRAYFFRVFTAANELRQKPWAALVVRDGAYSEVEEQVFLFNEQVDCFVFKGLVFVDFPRFGRHIRA